MMRNNRRLPALLLALCMVLSLTACGGQEQTADISTDTLLGTGQNEEGRQSLVRATEAFEGSFSPFFPVGDSDREVVELTTGRLLTTDRSGVPIRRGIEGETVSYNGTLYTYYGLGNAEISINDDGSADYLLFMRGDITFSDGEPATIDDVLFSLYVMADPMYDGSSEIYALPIEGMEEYRAGMQSRMDLILAAGIDGYEETDYYTEEQYDAFWRAFWIAGDNFAQAIVAWLIEEGYNTEEDSVEACAANWGYTLWEGATTANFFAAMVDVYGFDISDDGINYESPGVSMLELIEEELGDMSVYEAGVRTDESAPRISGIERTGSYSLRVHMTEYDVNALYALADIPIAPLHYYGDTALYDYNSDRFGFVKGDLSGVRAKTAEPLGCGPYVFAGYADGTVTLTANPYYYLGEPEVSELSLRQTDASEYISGIAAGDIDISLPDIADRDARLSIYETNAGSLSGNTMTTYLFDNARYGYIGINAELVNVGGDPDSDSSKALRKGFMTLFAACRAAAVDSYYGDCAYVLEYPISAVSWAAPRPDGERYTTAYSVDVDGVQLYDRELDETELRIVARQAAVGWFIAAGYTYDEETGQFTDMDEIYEIVIPGYGEQDHPACAIAEAASEVLAELGVTLRISDVGRSAWSNALDENTAMMWAAAWQSSVDPDEDMTQLYASDSEQNSFAIDDDELDALLVQARASSDTEYRRSAYLEIMEIAMDWGVVLPLYQRRDAVVTSTERVTGALPADMTPYWGWYAEVQQLTFLPPSVTYQKTMTLR